MWVPIRDVLAERIASGVYKPGDRLPVRCDIATEFGLSSGQPVSRALGELGARGLIRRAAGPFAGQVDPARRGARTHTERWCRAGGRPCGRSEPCSAHLPDTIGVPSPNGR
jgi:DNA-binding transcriptional MocR family regulator